FEGILLGELARVRLEQERYRECAQLCEEAIRIHRDVLDRRAEGYARERLGEAQLHLGLLEEARTQLDLAATLLQGAGELSASVLALARCACVEAARGSTALARESMHDAD